MSYDLEHPPTDEWRDEQDRSEWFEEAAHYWHGQAQRPHMVYIIERDGEPDVYAALHDAEEARGILQASDPDEALRYNIVEQVVFEPSDEAELGSTRAWLDELRSNYPPAE